MKSIDKINWSKVKEVIAYRNSKPPLSFRKIAKLMGSDVKSVYRWYVYNEKKLAANFKDWQDGQIIKK